MLSFGKKPPRQLDGFGVSGLLGADCHVFYDHIFSTRHLGKVSDLLSARLKEASIDELRLRAVLLYGILQGCESQRKDPGDGTLLTPIGIECGVDDEKFAVGVAFTLDEGKINTVGLAERITQGTPDGEFENLLRRMQQHCHRLILRIHSESNKAEIVALVGLAGRIESEAMLSEASVEIVDVAAPASEAPSAASYVQLGDLDYPGLLKDDSKRVSEGKAEDSNTRVKADKKTDWQKSVDSSADILNQETTLVKGSREAKDDSEVRISGDSAAPGGGPSVISKSPDLSPVKEKSYLAQIEGLKARIAELEAERGERAGLVTIAGSEAAADPAEDGESSGVARMNVTRTLTTMIQRIWPFRREDVIEADSEESGESDSSAGLTIVSGSSESAATMNEAPSSDGPGDAAVNTLLNEMQSGGVHKTIARAQLEVGEIKQELNNGRAKKWVDGLMSELVAEKARLSDMAKKLNSSVRQKELEFRGKEQSLLMELNRRDELVRQKNLALSRTKDQLAQLNLTLERLKAGAKSSTEEVAQKQKANQLQKLLQLSKDENAALAKKAEELRKQLNLAQMAAAKAQSPGTGETMAMKKNLERVMRQVEDYKKANTQLLEKLSLQEQAAKKQERTEGSQDELKKKLDAAMKMAAVSRKEAENAKMRLQISDREQKSLRDELEKAQAEIAALKSKGSGSAAA